MEPRMVTCDCGEEFALDSQEEIDHYVWSMRRDGSRSNLGYCPVKRGFGTAVISARETYGHAIYRGRVQ